MMGLSEKVMEALRSGILLNERVNTLINKVDRMDTDMRKINDRLIRVETVIEMASVHRGGGSKLIDE
jgi:hypothetical protein